MYLLLLIFWLINLFLRPLNKSYLRVDVVCIYLFYLFDLNKSQNQAERFHIARQARRALHAEHSCCIAVAFQRVYMQCVPVCVCVCVCWHTCSWIFHRLGVLPGLPCGPSVNMSVLETPPHAQQTTCSRKQHPHTHTHTHTRTHTHTHAQSNRNVLFCYRFREIEACNEKQNDVLMIVAAKRYAAARRLHLRGAAIDLSRPFATFPPLFRSSRKKQPTRRWLIGDASCFSRFSKCLEVAVSGSAVSRSVFQSGGWRFNPRPSRCALEQDTRPWVAPCSCVHGGWMYLRFGLINKRNVMNTDSDRSTRGGGGIRLRDAAIWLDKTRRRSSELEFDAFLLKQDSLHHFTICVHHISCLSWLWTGL